MIKTQILLSNMFSPSAMDLIESKWQEIIDTCWILLCRSKTEIVDRSWNCSACQSEQFYENEKNITVVLRHKAKL